MIVLKVFLIEVTVDLQYYVSFGVYHSDLMFFYRLKAFVLKVFNSFEENEYVTVTLNKEKFGGGVGRWDNRKNSGFVFGFLSQSSCAGLVLSVPQDEVLSRPSVFADSSPIIKSSPVIFPSQTVSVW